VYLIVGKTGAIKDRKKRPVGQLYIFFIIVILNVYCFIHFLNSDSALNARGFIVFFPFFVVSNLFYKFSYLYNCNRIVPSGLWIK